MCLYKAWRPPDLKVNLYLKWISMLSILRLKEETSVLTKDRNHIQYKLEKNVIFQQYLDKVLENAEEVFIINDYFELI